MTCFYMVHKKVNAVQSGANFGHGLADRFAGFRSQGSGQSLLLLNQQISKTANRLNAFSQGTPGPGRLSLTGLHRFLLNFGSAVFSNFLHQGFGRRINNGKHRKTYGF
jgi:hypothetical protein